MASKFKSVAKAVRYVKGEEMRLDEKKRRQAQIEREKRIQEQINKENQATIGRMTRASEKTRQFISQRGRQVQLQNNRRLQLQPDIYDTTKEISRTRINFNELIKKYDIEEPSDVASSSIEKRMEIMFEQLIGQFCKSKEKLPEEFYNKFLGVIREWENLTLSDRLDLVEAATKVVYGEPIEQDSSEEATPEHTFILHFIKILQSQNNDSAVNVFNNLLYAFFLPQSKHRKQYLHMLVNSGCWSAYDAIKMALKCHSLTVDLGTKILHKAKTHGVDFCETYGCLNAEDPLDALQKVVKTEDDKTLDNVMNEMKKNKVPEELLVVVKKIVSKVLEKLPSVFHLDLDANDILECIKKKKVPTATLR